MTYEEALAAATAPRSCPACGRLFIGPAFTVHRDGGAWVLRGSAAAPR